MREDTYQNNVERAQLCKKRVVVLVELEWSLDHQRKVTTSNAKGDGHHQVQRHLVLDEI